MLASWSRRWRGLESFFDFRAHGLLSRMGGINSSEYQHKNYQPFHLYVIPGEVEESLIFILIPWEEPEMSPLRST